MAITNPQILHYCIMAYLNGHPDIQEKLAAACEISDYETCFSEVRKVIESVVAACFAMPVESSVIDKHTRYCIDLHNDPFEERAREGYLYEKS